MGLKGPHFSCGRRPLQCDLRKVTEAEANREIVSMQGTIDVNPGIPLP